MSLRMLVFLSWLGGLLGPSVAMASAFGCRGLAEDHELPSLEGKEGVFYRLQSDLRMAHGVTDAALDRLARLSKALEGQGTRLIYVPVPTKSLAMPAYLPDSARLYGFDEALALEVHQALLRKIEHAGVAAVEATAALRSLPSETPPFFKSDFHWTPYGARVTAKTVAQRIRAFQTYATLPKTPHVSKPLEPRTAFSGMRRILQKRCAKSLPKVKAMQFETARVQVEGQALSLGDLLGTSAQTGTVALVGTSFSDSEISNFAGFLAEESSLEVLNYAITGGNQFGAILSYLTSADFAAARPDFLVWENPIYNSLTRFGDLPMEELIAAAEGNCDQPLPVIRVGDDILSVDLRSAALGDRLFLSSDTSGVMRATFRFIGDHGSAPSRTIHRSERMPLSGRFFIPLQGPSGADPKSAEIQIDRPFGPEAEVWLCRSKLREGN